MGEPVKESADVFDDLLDDLIETLAKKRAAVEKLIETDLKSGHKDHAVHVEVAKHALRRLGEAQAGLNTTKDALGRFESMFKQALDEATKVAHENLDAFGRHAAKTKSEKAKTDEKAKTEKVVK